jgi:hypothetical protein
VSDTLGVEPSRTFHFVTLLAISCTQSTMIQQSVKNMANVNDIPLALLSFLIFEVGLLLELPERVFQSINSCYLKQLTYKSNNTWSMGSFLSGMSFETASFALLNSTDNFSISNSLLSSS